MPEIVRVNTASIPESVRDNLAATVLECFKEFLSVPGNAEWLDLRIAEREAAAAEKKGADKNGVLLDLP